MISTKAIAKVATLVGDPARAAMLAALMDGRALTATELSGVAGIAPQTASGHLGRLTQAGLLSVERQGRHRYHRLSSPEVARMLEGIMQIAVLTANPRAKPPAPEPRDLALRNARTCYDHIAGRLGVEMAGAMQQHGYVEFGEDGGAVTERGTAFLRRLGLALEIGVQHGRGRAFCRPCLDWSERRHHLAGRLGAALLDHCLASGWVRRIKHSRALAITPKGQIAFRKSFGISVG